MKAKTIIPISLKINLIFLMSTIVLVCHSQDIDTKHLSNDNLPGESGSPEVVTYSKLGEFDQSMQSNDSLNFKAIKFSINTNDNNCLFIVKYNNAGSLQWIKKYYSCSDNEMIDVRIDRPGYIDVGNSDGGSVISYLSTGVYMIADNKMRYIKIIKE